MFRWLSPRLGLAALALALAGALAFEFTEEPPYAPSSAEMSRPHRAGGQGVGAVLPDFGLSSSAGAYATIAERPVLNPTRRPAPSQAVATATEPPKPAIRRGLYQLIGVTDFGDKKIAQVKEAATGRVQSVRKGDTLQELAVTSVDASSVTLAFAGETDVIALAKFTASGRVPRPVAPVAAAPPLPAVVPPPTAREPAAVPPNTTATPAPIAAVAAPTGQEASDDKIRRLSAEFAANPNNWNRSRLDTARGALGR